ncbi:MAG: hypothetical protein PHX80_05670 [Candidatus Nanoarchaeia archaeon]|nr:hypothetical protein [Candidatus Nanoarchaeia archaeon]
MAAKKKAKKRTSKRKVAKKRKSSKHILAALVRQPLGTLVKRSALIGEAIDIKRQKSAMKRGTFIGPRPPTSKQSAAMKKAVALSRKAQRLANLARARIARAINKGTFIGPMNDPQARRQHEVLRAAGVAGY